MVELALPVPQLSDASVSLRRWTEQDVPAVVAACRDPLIARFVAGVPSPYGEHEARTFLADQERRRQEGTTLDLAVTSTAADRAIGAIGLPSVDLAQGRASVGYWVTAEFRGRGVATAALRLLCLWAFDVLALRRLELFVVPGNIASQRVAERCGFLREGLLRSHLVMRSTGERADSLVYGLLPHDLPRV